MVKTFVIYGAPASGKSTYVKDKLGNNDLVFDYDDVMQSLTGLPYQEINPNLSEYVKDIRNLIIKRLGNEKHIDNAYIITTYAGSDFKESVEALRPRYIKMTTSREVCIKRINESDRKNKQELIRITNEWFNIYENENISHTEQAKQFYNSAVWQRCRQSYISKVHGLCERCSDIGLIVHHKVYINAYNIDDPSITLDHDNLEYLCQTCHNREHHGSKKEPLREGLTFDDDGNLIMK